MLTVFANEKAIKPAHAAIHQPTTEEFTSQYCKFLAKQLVDGT
ncbi:MAG: hypothetical protein RMJ44_08975 [Cytophagales bacterium]|nr:hypothetical protein [Bernardetiaceae bacterium]MDW8211206.1 hypothetical protein [Cytophagales bacterium]